jgi:tRNA pseudouridine38-40 synthase|tara:strand:- start:1843 stop:2787 length:945 start_codon:yes stop_codon:yes gene_type:complete
MIGFTKEKLSIRDRSQGQSLFINNLSPYPLMQRDIKRVPKEIEDFSECLKGVRLISSLTKMVLIVEYDGSGYCGSQLQENLPTIQGEIEKALFKLTGGRVRVAAASRTDSGVHALGQVVSFRTKSLLTPETFASGLNHYLPKDIAVKGAYRVSDSFNVRRHATSREYSYYILNDQVRSPIRAGFCHLVTGKLNILAMNRVAQALVGEHDFASFATSLGVETKNTLRRVYQAKVEKDGELVVFNVMANSFLPHQVRNTVGALIRVGLGKMTAREFYSIMEAKKPALAGATAPAHGLCLIRVNYNNHFGENDNENV